MDVARAISRIEQKLSHGRRERAHGLRQRAGAHQGVRAASLLEGRGVSGAETAEEGKGEGRRMGKARKKRRALPVGSTIKCTLVETYSSHDVSG